MNSIDKEAKERAVTLVFGDSSNGYNSDVFQDYTPVEVFDALLLSGGLNINIECHEYSLLPFLSELDEDSALELLQDAFYSFQDALRPKA